MRMLLYLFAVAACIMWRQDAFSEGDVFPDATPSISPKQAWEIRSEQDKKHEGVYRLFLRNRRTGLQREIFSGERYCEVLWSPDDSHVAITDWAGSNLAEIYLLDMKETGS